MYIMMSNMKKYLIHIINLAAIAGETACIGIPQDEVLRNNYQLPVHISDRLRPDQFMVQVSTTAVYGDLDGNNIDGVEAKVSNALGRYASSKLMADVLLLGLPNVAVVRIPTLYGISPVMRKNILIHDMCEQAVKHDEVVVFGDGDSVRPIGHVEAVAEELISIIRHREHGLHLLAAENMSKAQIARQIADSAGCEVMRADWMDLIKQDHYMEPPKLTGRLKDHVGRIIDTYRIML